MDVPVIMLAIAKLPQEVVVEVEAEVIAADEAAVVEEIVTITMVVETNVSTVVGRDTLHEIVQMTDSEVIVAIMAVVVVVGVVTVVVSQATSFETAQIIIATRYATDVINMVTSRETVRKVEVLVPSAISAMVMAI